MRICWLVRFTETLAGKNEAALIGNGTGLNYSQIKAAATPFVRRKRGIGEIVWNKRPSIGMPIAF